MHAFGLCVSVLALVSVLVRLPWSLCQCACIVLCVSVLDLVSIGVLALVLSMYLPSSM